MNEQVIKIRTYILNDCVYCLSSMSVDLLCCEEDEIWLFVLLNYIGVTVLRMYVLWQDSESVMQ
jgi:hypothetical protein